MDKIFDMDSPIMRFLSRMADLMILNIITLICCIPIITVGASLTALHYILLKMARNEEGYIVKSFFKSFKENFKQATVIWLIILLLILIFIGDLLIFNYSAIEFPVVLRIAVMALFIFVSMIVCYVFPVLSRFENTVFHTIKNSFFISILSFPKTILMLVLYVIPVAAVYFFPIAMPLVFLFGISAPAYCAALLYSGTFKKLEPEEETIIDRFETDNKGDIAEN